MEARNAVVLIAKAPLPGQVKTRLCPPLSTVQAAAVASALLRDTADAATATDADTWCAYHGDKMVLRRLLPDAVGLLPQRGEDLAQRLAAAQADVFARGYERVVLYGADCPTVGAADLCSALRSLDQTDVVLGPAADGGYTLLASSRPTPELFDGVVMSTDRVLADTLSRAAGLTVTLLGTHHDLDTIADLLAALDSGQLNGAPRTHALVCRLRAEHGSSQPHPA
jgi:rSAM/selenodomain-associated transferase 1